MSVVVRECMEYLRMRINDSKLINNVHRLDGHDTRVKRQGYTLRYLVVVQQEVVNVFTLVVPSGAVLLGAAPEEDALWEHTSEDGGGVVTRHLEARKCV